MRPRRAVFDRREFVVAGAAIIAAGFPVPAESKPESERAKVGDRIVISDGPLKGQTLTLDNVVAGDPPLKALPVDIETGTIRSRSRFNKLLVVRLDPEQIGEEFRAHAAEGVLAYSAICTHQGCDVSAWLADKKLMACFCHHSEFDPAAGGKVMGGPATARLPILPLTVTNGELRVAADFTAKPGPRKK
jgi:rieske iron-sulfur protein